MKTNFENALATMPKPEADLFRDINQHPDYDCAALKIQRTIYFRGSKVGGLNPSSSEWYFSRVFVADCGGIEKVERQGFKKMLKKPDHEYWGRSGAGSVNAFRIALGELTGVRIQSTCA